MRKSLVMSSRLLLTLSAIAILMLSTGVEVDAQEKPIVRFYLFYGETCVHCHEVMDNFLPSVHAKYGDQVEYRYVEVFGPVLRG